MMISVLCPESVLSHSVESCGTSLTRPGIVSTLSSITHLFIFLFFAFCMHFLNLRNTRSFLNMCMLVSIFIISNKQGCRRRMQLYSLDYRFNSVLSFKLLIPCSIKLKSHLRQIYALTSFFLMQNLPLRPW